jgi:hypothetical protein
MSNQFIVIDTQAKMDEFLYLVDRFHDALLREVGIISRGYVAPDGDMYGDVAPSDARKVGLAPLRANIHIFCPNLTPDC